MLRGIWALVALVIILLMVGVPVAMADEVTPEPVDDAVTGFEVVAPVGESALVVDVTNTLRESVTDVVAVVVGAIGAVVMVLAGTFAVVISRLGSQLYQSTPIYYKDALASFLDKFTLQLQSISKDVKTPFEFDDVFANKLREMVVPIIVGELTSIAKQHGAGDAPNG
jgi:hypothetical protein